MNSSTEIQHNIALAGYTTMRVGGEATHFVEVHSTEESIQAFDYAKKNKLRTWVLGGGSNTIVPREGFQGLVIKVAFPESYTVIEETEHEALVEVSAGAHWDDFVAWTVDHKLWGVENLSHIPGHVGGAPVQNVGAYGQEVSQTLKSVLALDSHAENFSSTTFLNSDCRFGYRSSIFNTTQKGRYLIVTVTFKLSKVPMPMLHYKDLADFFAADDADGCISDPTKRPTQSNIRNAVIAIRDKKFPLPNITPNSGSCFKNITLKFGEYNSLLSKIETEFSTDVANKLAGTIEKQFLNTSINQNTLVKIPSAFLIDICQLKGERVGGAYLNPAQPLIILNDGTATADDILALHKKVCDEVYKKTGLTLSREPELMGK